MSVLYKDGTYPIVANNLQINWINSDSVFVILESHQIRKWFYTIFTIVNCFFYEINNTMWVRCRKKSNKLAFDYLPKGVYRGTDFDSFNADTELTLYNLLKPINWKTEWICPECI